MKELFRGTLFLSLLLMVPGFAGNSFADPWLDTVVSFDRPAGSSNDGGPSSYALGPNDGKYVSIDIPETLILAFTDNTAFDGAGNDLRIYQVIAGDSDVRISASKDNSTYVELGTFDGDVLLDFSNYSGLEYVNYLKFVGLQNGGNDAGYDLDAVEALNSRDNAPAVPEPATLVLLGLGLVGLVGMKKIKK